MVNLRVMAIDYGDACIGAAISNPIGLLAGYTTVVQSRREGVVAEELVRLAKEHGVDELVMGLPRNMDGTKGPQAELYRAFAARLEEVCGLKPILRDKRRTAVEAHGILRAPGKRMKQHKETVDTVVAALILEGYLTGRKEETTWNRLYSMSFTRPSPVREISLWSRSRSREF